MWQIEIRNRYSADDTPRTLLVPQGTLEWLEEFLIPNQGETLCLELKRVQWWDSVETS